MIPDDWQGEVREATATLDKLFSSYGGSEGYEAWKVVRRELSGVLQWVHRMLLLERRIGLIREVIDGEQDGKLIEPVSSEKVEIVHDSLTYLPAMAVAVEGRLPGYSVVIRCGGHTLSLRDYIQCSRDQAEMLAQTLNQAMTGHEDTTKAWVRVDVEAAQALAEIARNLEFQEDEDVRDLIRDLGELGEEAEEEA